MPVIKLIGRLKISMYADDHYPPHFHIVAPDFEVLVGIRGLPILKGGRHRRELGPALEWAAANTALLENMWAQLNAE